MILRSMLSVHKTAK